MLTFKSNGVKFRRELARAAKAESIVIRNALNDTVRDVALKDLPRNIRRHFDAPTRFTQRAFYYERAVPAGGGHWKASVKYKYGSKGFRYGSGAAPGTRHYLETQVFGGARAPKAVERLIAGKVNRPGFPRQFYPTSYVPRDRHGNVTRGFWNKVLSDLQAQRQVGSTSNRSAASMKRNKRYRSERFFIPAASRTDLAPGVWVRKGREVHPVLVGTKAMRYRKRLPLFDIERRAVRHRFPLHVKRGQAKQAISRKR